MFHFDISVHAVQIFQLQMLTFVIVNPYCWVWLLTWSNFDCKDHDKPFKGNHILRKLRVPAFRNKRSDKVTMAVGQFHCWWYDDSLYYQVTHYIDDMIIVIISYVITDAELQRKCRWFIGLSLHFVDKATMLPLSSLGIVNMPTISILSRGHFDADSVIPDGMGDDHLNDNLWCSKLWPIEHRDNIQIWVFLKCDLTLRMRDVQSF